MIIYTWFILLPEYGEHFYTTRQMTVCFILKTYFIKSFIDFF